MPGQVGKPLPHQIPRLCESSEPPLNTRCLSCRPGAPAITRAREWPGGPAADWRTLRRVTEAPLVLHNLRLLLLSGSRRAGGFYRFYDAVGVWARGARVGSPVQIGGGGSGRWMCYGQRAEATDIQSTHTAYRAQQTQQTALYVRTCDNPHPTTPERLLHCPVASPPRQQQQCGRDTRRSRCFQTTTSSAFAQHLHPLPEHRFEQSAQTRVLLTWAMLS